MSDKYKSEVLNHLNSLVIDAMTLNGFTNEEIRNHYFDLIKTSLRFYSQIHAEYNMNKKEAIVLVGLIAYIKNEIRKPKTKEVKKTKTKKKKKKK